MSRYFLKLKKAFTCLFCLFSLSIWSQNNLSWTTPVGASTRLLTYRKSMVAETVNFVLTDAKNKSKVSVLKPNQSGFLQKFNFPTVETKDIIGAFNERLWVANERKLVAYDLLTTNKLEEFMLPDGVEISHLTLGFDNTVFFIDNQKGQIHVLSKGVFTLLAEDTRLKTASSMLIIGGRVYIGNENSILLFNISKKAVSVYADNLKPVLALDTDHLMHVVALTTENVIRINTKNEKEIVLDTQAGFVSLSINPEAKKMFLLDKKGIVSAYDYLALTKENADEWAMKNKRKMKVFETKDLFLVGSEYILHAKNDNPDLRETGLEGFYPEKNKVENGEMADITPNAKTMECAEKSFKAFQKWSKKVSTSFKNTGSTGTPPTFWLMVNDYSGIKGQLDVAPRKAQVWYWKRNPAVVGRYPGFWKWEAVLNQKCVCELPDTKEADKYFNEFIKTNALKN